MIFEDEISQLETIKRSLHNRFPKSDIHTESNPYTVFNAISLFNPNVLIVDYQFKGLKITDEEHIMQRLFKFNGLVIIYSSHEVIDIKNDFHEICGGIPENFRIISKREPFKLIKEIAKYNDKY